MAQGHAFFHRAGALLSNAIGPNPKLVNGSNNALIAGNKDRHQPIGPNRSIRVGPIGPESIQVVEQELRIN